jgi:hypothetical protein
LWPHKRLDSLTALTTHRSASVHDITHTIGLAAIAKAEKIFMTANAGGFCVEEMSSHLELQECVGVCSVYYNVNTNLQMYSLLCVPFDLATLYTSRLATILEHHQPSGTRQRKADLYNLQLNFLDDQACARMWAPRRRVDAAYGERIYSGMDR